MSLPNSSPLDSKPHPHTKPILCYVTERRSLQVASQKDLIQPLLEKIDLVAAAGVDWMQLREKDLSGKLSASLTREALHRVSKQASHQAAATRILVNDRLDVALAEQAGGVHLGENSLPVQEAKRLLSRISVREIAPTRFSRWRFVPLFGSRPICRRRWRRLHFLRPRLRHAVESRVWTAARSRSSRGSLLFRQNSCSGHWWNHRRKRVHLPLSRCLRHRRHPLVSGLRRSRQRRPHHSSAKFLSRR